MLRPEAGDEIGQDERRNGRDDPEPDLPAHRQDGFFGQARDVLGAGQQFPGAPGDLFAEGRHQDVLAIAFNEVRAQQTFQLLEPGAECRLRDEAGFGGPGEVTMVSEGDQILELLQGGDCSHAGIVIDFFNKRKKIYSLDRLSRGA